MLRKNKLLRNEITKANALKKAAIDKHEELDKTLAKIFFFIEKKRFVIRDQIFFSFNLLLFLFP